MDFSAFDKTELEKYTAEAKRTWGDTAAYREFEAKTQNGLPDAQGLMQIYAELGGLKQLAPEDGRVQAAVEKLRRYLTEHYYTCTPQILRGLGTMYSADARFAANLDAAGGAGTAAFAEQAITAYCNAREE